MSKSGRHFFVVTPVLNGKKFLQAALASIDAQTCGNWTHYVVDGGSTDATLDIIRKSLEVQPRRHLIQGRDRGLYDAVFKGFAAIEAGGMTDGDICLWLNADDCLAPWAFATMQLAFDIYNADWITGLPGRWDAEGRLALVEPNGWYPRWFIAQGWFNICCLGSIQQESTFFTARLLRRLSPASKEQICRTRLAGDFLLWREFARFSPLCSAPTVIGGFRLHDSNLSIGGTDRLIGELRAHGAVTMPRDIARIVRFLYRIVAAIVASMRTRYPLAPRDKNPKRDM